MADIYSKAKRSQIMSHVRARGNLKTELALQSFSGNIISSAGVAISSCLVVQTLSSVIIALQYLWMGAFGMAVRNTRPDPRLTAYFGKRSCFATRIVTGW